MTAWTAVQRRWLRRVTAVALVLALGGAAAAYWLWGDLHRFADTPLAANTTPVLTVEPGDGLRRVLARIEATGTAIGRPLYWQWLAWEMDVAKRLQAGEFALTPDLTPRTLLQLIADGRVIQYRFTVIEGWNFRELRAALAADPVLKQTTTALSERKLMCLLDASDVEPEGRFLPETYQFARGFSDLDLLRQAYAAMGAALQDAWTGKAPNLPLKSVDEALILASIIEKETAAAAERPAIAGVFVRRLRLGMWLQTDPTVIYGLGDSFDGNLTRQHLLTDTPFNTYTRGGLPPTPIALPGRAAISAAVHPEDGDALYFVARGDGTHVFSHSLAEHQAAVRRFQLRP